VLIFVYLDHFDLRIFLLASMIMIVASFSTLEMVENFYQAKRKIKWLLFSSFIMGIGIWSFHFMGMLGNDIQGFVSYRLDLTVLSLLFALLFSYMNIYYMTKSNSKRNILICTIFMMVGMNIVHFLGMKSMIMSVDMQYNTMIILVGELIAAICLYITYYVLAHYHQKRWTIPVSSLLFGIGLSGFHLNAMIAVKLVHYPTSFDLDDMIQFTPFSYSLSPDALAYWLGVTVLIIISSIVVTAQYDKHEAKKNQLLTEIHYQSLVEHNPNLVLTINNQGIVTDVNQKGIEILKRSRENLIGKSLLLFFQKENQHLVETKLAYLIDEINTDIELPIQMGDDNWLIMDFTFVPIMVNKEKTGVFVIGRDISELIAYKEQVKKVEQELKQTLESQHGLTLKFVEKDGRFIHTMCEGQLVYQLGLTPEKIVGRDLREIVPDDYANWKIQFYQKAWEGEITYYEAEFNGVDYCISLMPVLKNGQVVEVIGSGIDITERKSIEKIKARKRQWYRNIFNEMSECVLLYCGNGGFTALNDNAYKLFGVEKEELLAKLLYNPEVEFIKLDGSRLTPEEYPIHITVHTGRALNGEIIGVKSRNQVMWLSVNTKLIDDLEQTDSSRVLLTMSDITLQKEQELKLRESNALRRTLIDSLPMGIIVVDYQMNIRQLNRPFCEMFDIICPLKQLVGKNIQNVEVLSKHQYLFAIGHSLIEELKISDGKIIKRTYIPFYMKQELKGHLWTFEDITEQKRMEQGIIEAKEEAIKANMAKSEFLSSMSHELRTPLNGILGFSQLMELQQSLTPQQQMYVQEIIKGGRHLLTLINEVLDLSRIEAGKLVISNNNIHVKTVIDECINLIKPTAEQKQLSIATNFENCSTINLYLDQVRLKQVLLNLLDNAIKYNITGGEIRVECYCEGSSLVVHVKDTGIGIPTELHERVFEPFYRVNHSNNEGTGIGLSLVKQLVQLMEGEIGVKSVQGEGSNFWFSIPMVEAKQEDEPLLEESMDSLMDVQQKKILYIEDNVANLELVTEIFHSIPEISLYKAKTGMEGIQIVNESNIDLILLDMNLPDYCGCEVLDLLKANPQTSDIPVFALSANAMQEDIDHALAKGFDKYITKPIDIHSFVNEVLYDTALVSK
jgi:PAS domain S-box-containing protein